LVAQPACGGARPTVSLYPAAALMLAQRSNARISPAARGQRLAAESESADRMGRARGPRPDHSGANRTEQRIRAAWWRPLPASRRLALARVDKKLGNWAKLRVLAGMRAGQGPPSPGHNSAARGQSAGQGGERGLSPAQRQGEGQEQGSQRSGCFGVGGLSPRAGAG